MFEDEKCQDLNFFRLNNHHVDIALPWHTWVLVQKVVRALKTGGFYTGFKVKGVKYFHSFYIIKIYTTI